MSKRVEHTSNCPKISFVVPVYKVEPYIRQNLESLYEGGEENPDVEVIVVNDGTPDQSMAIVREFVDRYGNILVVEQENQGLSTARMNGLNHASGEFIWFIDSDDWLKEGAVSSMISLLDAHPGIDIVMTPLHWCHENPAEDKIDIPIDEDRIFTGKEILQSRGFPIWAAPRYIIRHTLFENPSLVFPSGLLHEDEYFGRVLLAEATRVLVTKTIFYNYRQRTGSIMDTVSIRSSYDLLKIYRDLKQYAFQNLQPDDRKWFIRHCHFLLVRSYLINEDKWETADFLTFVKRNRHYIRAEIVKAYQSYTFKEWTSMLMLFSNPELFRKRFPSR